jgi:hypothetical protein
VKPATTSSSPIRGCPGSTPASSCVAGLFYLADSSTNGTYLLEEGSAEHCIKRDEFILGEKGHIGCGFSPADNMSDAVAFAID